MRDIRAWLLRLAPPDDRSAVGEASAGVAYLHNDINTRPESEARRFVSGLCRPRVALLTPRPWPPRPVEPQSRASSAAGREAAMPRQRVGGR